MSYGVSFALAVLTIGQVQAEDRPPPRTMQAFAHYADTIAQPCRKVWPVLIDRRQWMAGFDRQEATTPASPFVIEHGRGEAEGQWRFERVIESVAPRRFVVAMLVPTMNATAVADQTLVSADDGRRCRVMIAVFVSIPWPSTVTDAGQAAMAEAAMLKGTREKIAADQVVLREVVEGRRARLR